MPFHRYVDPTYDRLGGAFPGVIGAQTYDRINVISGGTGGGGSSNADGPKVGGPNAGTYLVAFGEDATSSFANRGLRALAQNTDFLDDIVRGSIPRPTTIDYPSPNSIFLELTGHDVFVGDSAGVPAANLIHVVTQTGEQVFSDEGFPIVVVDIDNGSPPTEIGSGFINSPRLRFSHAVRVPLSIICGTRTSKAHTIESPDRDMVFSLAMNAFVKGVLGASLSTHGLDERYRRSTGPSTQNPDVDTPGSGATIVRDGQSVTMLLPEVNLRAASWPDPLMAAHTVRNQSFDRTSQEVGYGGDIGYLALTTESQILGSGTFEVSSRSAIRAAHATLMPRDLRAPTISGGTALTFIPAGAGATLNPGGVSDPLIELDAPYYFKVAGETGVYSGDDYLLVTRADGRQEAYLLDVDVDGSLGLANNQAHLILPTGLENQDPWFPANEAVTVQWYSTYYMGGGVARGPFQWFQPRALTVIDADWTGAGRQGMKLTGFLPTSSSRPNADHPEDMTMFSVYAAGPTDNDRVQKLQINSFGDVVSGGTIDNHQVEAIPYEEGGTGQFYGTYATRTRTYEVTASGGSELYEIDPRGYFSGVIGAPGRGVGVLIVRLNAVPSSSFLSLNFRVSNPAFGRLTVGTEFEVVIHNVQGQRYQITWSTLSPTIRWVWSDPSDAESVGASEVAGSILRFKGRVIRDSGVGGDDRIILMERHEYGT